ncbi:MAG: hypothetical protein R6U50_17905 [Desulfobacterales bacterium]
MTSKNRNQDIFHIIIRCFVFFMVPMLFGCASMSSLVDTTKKVDIPLISSGNAYKKKIGILAPQSNSSDRGMETARLLHARVTELLSKNEGVLMIAYDDPEAPPFLAAPPRSSALNAVDSLILAEKSRREGFLACVGVAVKDVSVLEKKSGFAWFKNTKETARIRMTVDVYGSRTGAKIMCDDFIREVDLEPGERQKVEEDDYATIDNVRDAVSDAGKDIAKAIEKVLKDEPWRGFVVAVEDGKAVISSGSEVGISVGDVFEVQDVYGTIQGPDGNRYRIPGTAVDEIEIVSVSAGESRGISVLEKQIDVGNTIQVRRN